MCVSVLSSRNHAKYGHKHAHDAIKATSGPHKFFLHD